MIPYTFNESIDWVLWVIVLILGSVLWAGFGWAFLRLNPEFERQFIDCVAQAQWHERNMNLRQKLEFNFEMFTKFLQLMVLLGPAFWLAIWFLIISAPTHDDDDEESEDDNEDDEGKGP